MRPQLAIVATLSVALASAQALCQQSPQVLGDLAAMNPRKLSKEDLQQLMPGAKMSRLSAVGNPQAWTNDPDGTFIVSSDNRFTAGGNVMGARSYTAPGKWHISGDGRYCVRIDWKSVPSEEWCRFIFQTSNDYYAANADQEPAEKVFKYQISK